MSTAAPKAVTSSGGCSNCRTSTRPGDCANSAASAEARAKVTDYVTTLFEAGEKDMHRLTVCGLTYLRELDGSSDPVKAGFTGL